MVAVFAPARGGWRLFVARRPHLQLGRSLLLLDSTSLFFTALRHMPLAETTAVSFTSPSWWPCSRAGFSASGWTLIVASGVVIAWWDAFGSPPAPRQR